MHEEQRKIRVAIIGGSIAGCTLANGILQHRAPNVVFDVFDAKSSFRERGAGVAVAPNAKNALKAMGLDAEAMLKEAGAVLTTGTTCYIGVGEHKGQPILELPGGVSVVDRVRMLEVLLKDLPPEHLHSNKKLSSIQEPAEGEESPYIINFEDGTSHEADIVVGADGQRSKVREIVLGPEHKDKWGAEFGGYWDARGRLSPEDAAAKFGPELFDSTEPQQRAIVGDGAFVLFGPMNDGKVMNVVVSAVAGPHYDKTAWKTQLSREFLEESYKDWSPNFRRGIVDALMADDSGPGMVFSEWQMPETRTYSRDRICIMGDAAHATLPWMGQGAAQSIEDAAVMSILLRAVKSRGPVQLAAATKAYDKVRRSGPEYVIRQSQEAAKLLTGQISLDPSETAKLNAPDWWEKIRGIDMEAHVKQAVDFFHIFKQT